MGTSQPPYLNSPFDSKPLLVLYFPFNARPRFWAFWLAPALVG